MIGKTVSHYRITRELGAGGMGVVYEAVDTKLDRTVALKFLPPESTRDPDAKARFVHEAKAASAIDHPNVCNIFEIDETDDGQLFLAMACYEGETLKDRISRGPLPLDDALDLTRQVAEGLTKAHERDIVHRDIKPANIFITNDGVVKILDFGLAKLAGFTQLTQEGTTLGTAHYMSPEQVNGLEVDHRSDLWCQGVCLYEMITGRVPFQGDHPQAVAYATLNSEPEPVTALRTGVPLEFERIIGKCLAKDPAERYQHVDDLLADLRVLMRVSDSAKARTTPPQPAGSSRKWVWSAIAVVVLLTTAGLFGLKSKDGQHSGEDPLLALMTFSNLGSIEKENRLASFNELISIGLIEFSPMRVISREFLKEIQRRHFPAELDEIGEEKALEVAQRAGADFMLTGKVGKGDKGYFTTWRLVSLQEKVNLTAGKTEAPQISGLVDAVLRTITPVLLERTDSEPVSGKGSITEFTSESPEAMEVLTAALKAKEQGLYEDAHAKIDQALEIDSKFGLAFLEKSRLLYSSESPARDGSRAAKAADRAWEQRAHLGQKDRLRLDVQRAMLAQNFSEALTGLEEMAARWPDDRQVLLELAEVYVWFWYVDQALEVYQEAKELFPGDQSIETRYFNILQWVKVTPHEILTHTKSLVEEYPGVSAYWANLGWAYYWAAEPDSAEQAIRKAVELGLPDAQVRALKAFWDYMKGDLNGHQKYVYSELKRSDLAPGTRVSLLAENRLAPALSLTYVLQGRFEKALEVFSEAEAYVQGPESLVWLERDRSMILFRLGRFEEVREWAQALQFRTEVPEADKIGVKFEALALVGLDSLTIPKRSAHTLFEKQDTWGDLARISGHFLQAKIALVEGDPDLALEQLGLAESRVTLKGGLYGIEMFETRSEALTMAGRFEEAVANWHELLRYNGGHALVHYELGKLYEKMNQPGNAVQEYGEFLGLWSEADEGLPQLTDARSRLAALRAHQ